MKTMEITEGNKLIAEFMERFRIEKESALIYYVNGYKFTLQEERADYVGYFMDLFCNPKNSNSVKYHSSWDWLMPVVEKIEVLGFQYEITHKYCAIWKPNSEPNFTIKEDGNTTIQAIYRAVIQFIRQHNN